MFLKIFLQNGNLQSYNPYVINLKEHLLNYDEGYPCQNSLLVDAERQYHTKAYNNISSILF